MKYRREDATHFLSYEDPETGVAELLDCLPLGENQDGSCEVVVFDENNDSAVVCSVDSNRILSVDEVSAEVVGRLVSDAALLMAGGKGTYH